MSEARSAGDEEEGVAPDSARGSRAGSQATRGSGRVGDSATQEVWARWGFVGVRDSDAALIPGEAQTSSFRWRSSLTRTVRFAAVRYRHGWSPGMRRRLKPRSRRGTKGTGPTACP